MRHASGHPLGFVVLVATMTACGPGTRAGSDRPDVPGDAPPAADSGDPGAPGDEDSLVDAAPGSGDAADAEVDVAPAWLLSPCYRACDRVVSCAVDACAGYDWSSAGTRFEDCFAACDEGRASALLAAPACGDVLALHAADVASFAAGCDSNPCDPACSSFAACLHQECPALATYPEETFASDCRGWCRPQDAAWIVEMPCTDLVQAMVQGDASFATACNGPPTACPGPDLCDPYGSKIASCIQAECAPAADPYAQGLARVLSITCAAGANCPKAADVQAVLAPAFTCDSPGLKGLGHQPPFQAVCEGTLGVTPAQVAEACSRLVPCPGAEWLSGADGCAGFLVVIADAATRVPCLSLAADCAAAYGCLEGL